MFSLIKKLRGVRDREIRSQTNDALSDIDGYLVAIAGRILQTSNRKANIALGAAAHAVTGSAMYAGVMGAVSLVGTASTGTAIAGLFGAAKTSASLFWIGGLVGGGVATGGAILAAGTIGAGVYGSVKLRRALMGRGRSETELSDEETRVLSAILALKTAIEAQKKSGRSARPGEIVVFSRIGVTPLVDELYDLLDRGVFQNLTFYNRVRFRGHLNNLRSFLKSLGKT